MEIYKTTKCDTRAIEKSFDVKDVESDTLKHKLAVQNACSLIATRLIIQAQEHDFTKLGGNLEMVYRALKTGFKNDELMSLDLWKIHTNIERHHLNDHCPEDVNLIDVIEMLCDCVCAGLARSGNVYEIKISDETLQKAVENTVKILRRDITVV